MRRLTATATFLALFSALSVQAATYVAYSDPANQGVQAYPGNLALNFNVLSPITVTELGVFNASGSGFITGPIQVAIYDTGANALVTPVVTFQSHPYPQGGLGFDVFQPISPVVLGPGSYLVDAIGFSSNDPNGNLTAGSSTGPQMDTGGGLLSFTGASWDSNGSLDNPNGSCGGCYIPPAQYSQFDAGTFQFTGGGGGSGVPEPATFALFGCGFLGIAAILRRRRVR